MNIVVLGAGTVGTHIADLLCSREHSVTVVDSDYERTRRINDDLDVRVVNGSASQSVTLFQAGISSADLCLAVTGNDEVNIVAASMAKVMGARRALARVYAPIFHDLSTFDYQRHFQIDRLLSLEHLTAAELARHARDPGSVMVEQFTRGELQVLSLEVASEGKSTRAPLKDLKLPSNVRVGTITRNGRTWIVGGEDHLEVGDRLVVFCRLEHSRIIRGVFDAAPPSQKRIVIAGGGETGLHLARTLEREGFATTLLESDEARCQRLASILGSTTVVLCDATQRRNLEEERVGRADIFVACTGDDEDNIMLCVEARDLGTSQIMAVIGRPDYASVMGKLGIDHAVSAREVTAKQILAYLTRGIEISRSRLPGSVIDVIEVEVAAGAPLTRVTLAESNLPQRSLIGAVIQHDYVCVPEGDHRMQPGDVAILLAEEDVAPAALAQFTPE